MSVDRRRTQPIMAWWCECGTRCEAYRQCPHCGRWPAPEPEPEGGDWWDPDDEGLCIWAAYQPKGAANFAASLVDLSGNGNNAGDPGGAATPTWDAVNGWKFDGIAQYLTTTFVPQNDQSQSMLVQITNCNLNAEPVLGTREAFSEWFEIENSAGGLVRYRNGDALSGPLGAMANGNLAVAGAWGYQNGVIDLVVPIGGWAGPTTTPLLIGCTNNAGVPALFKLTYIQAVAIYDCTLTAPQVLAVATAMTLV